jgi:hypothetical protein
MVDRSYSIAIGWVGQTVLSDRSEQLRMATIWFEDRADEDELIRQVWEVPLFTVRRHVLARAGVAFYNDTMSGVYVRTEGTDEE